MSSFSTDPKYPITCDSSSSSRWNAFGMRSALLWAMCMCLIVAIETRSAETPGKRYGYLCLRATLTNRSTAQYNATDVAGIDDLCLGVSPGPGVKPSDPLPAQLKNRVNNEFTGYDRLKLRYDLNFSSGRIMLSTDPSLCLQRRSDRSNEVFLRKGCSGGYPAWNLSALTGPARTGVLLHVGTGKCVTAMRCLRKVLCTRADKTMRTKDKKNGPRTCTSYCERDVNEPVTAISQTDGGASAFVAGTYLKLAPCWFTRGADARVRDAQVFQAALDCAPGCTAAMLGNGACDTACANAQCELDAGDCLTAAPTPPTLAPTASPSASPTLSPTHVPSSTPTLAPSSSPTLSPTFLPSSSPTHVPSANPTASPTSEPSAAPSSNPSKSPTLTFEPTLSPTLEPTSSPTLEPTFHPSHSPSSSPTQSPTLPIGNGASPLLWLLFLLLLLLILCCCFGYCLWGRRRRREEEDKKDKKDEPKKEEPKDEETPPSALETAPIPETTQKPETSKRDDELKVEDENAVVEDVVLERVMSPLREESNDGDGDEEDNRTVVEVELEPETEPEPDIDTGDKRDAVSSIFTPDPAKRPRGGVPTVAWGGARAVTEHNKDELKRRSSQLQNEALPSRIARHRTEKFDRSKLERLSVRELKELIEGNGGSVVGLVEKNDLIERALALQRD